MIIKGRSRAGARQLASHLLRTDQNEVVRAFEFRGTTFTTVQAALLEMELFGLSAKSAKPLYHASINPEWSRPLTDEQIRIAVDTLESSLAFDNQARMIIVHEKKGRRHIHAVWSRVDIDRGRVISDSWNYRAHEQAARALEAMFSHRPVPNSHSSGAKRRRTINEYELRQEERTGRSTEAISAEITDIWRNAADGQDFVTRLKAAGYRLARGDRRVFVVIDRDGETHSLARRISGFDTQAIRSRLSNIRIQALPSVAEAKERQALETKSVETFRVSAVEVGLRRQGLRPAWFEHPAASSGSRSSRPTKRISISRSNADRMLIIAEFAAKIANAQRTTPDHQLAATLSALYAARAAALEAFHRQEAGKVIFRQRLKRQRRYKTRRFLQHSVIRNATQ